MTTGGMACDAIITQGPMTGEVATGSLAGYRRHRSAGEEACDECRRAATERQRRWPTTREQRRRKGLFHNHRVSLNAWTYLSSFQDDRCATCGVTSNGDREWHTDHDHRCCPGRRSCGRCIRGLLCTHCNVALGYVERATEGGNARLAGAFAAYVTDPPMKRLGSAVESATVMLGAALQPS